MTLYFGNCGDCHQPLQDFPGVKIPLKVSHSAVMQYEVIWRTICRDCLESFARNLKDKITEGCYLPESIWVAGPRGIVLIPRESTCSKTDTHLSP